MTLIYKPTGKSGRQLSVDEEIHLLNHDDRMVDLSGRIFKRSSDILGFEVRIILEDLLFSRPASKHIQHILHANAQSPNARTSTTLSWI